MCNFILVNYTSINLFYFILFYFVLFCFILFYFVLFCFVVFYFILFCFILFCYVLFCFVMFCFVLFCFILFYIFNVVIHDFISFTLSDRYYTNRCKQIQIRIQTAHTVIKKISEKMKIKKKVLLEKTGGVWEGGIKI